MARSKQDFPRYLMQVDGETSFMSLAEAKVAYQDDFAHVVLEKYVLHEDMSVKIMTPEEHLKMSEKIYRERLNP